MRVKKSELAGMVRQLSEINDQIEKKGMIPDDVNLSECQELAVKLGDFIEEIYEKTNTKGIIHPLEVYCELIYQMSLVENQNKIKLCELARKNRKSLLDVEHGIESDLPEDRKQILFLPYKVSMWDSLESIWMAARDDPEVDAYVMPIPYFDRKPDGSFGEMHYEGYDYPDYVPVIDWKKYKIPEEKPDVIFIHNPYDNCNYVTSVHPDYYSTELKKWTGCLVYIPYYVLGKVLPGCEPAIAGMRHLIITEAVFHADFVFVQDNDMAIVFRNELVKFYQDNGVSIDTDYLGKKIQGIGSPKYDKVLHMNDENTPICEEWIHTIKSKKPGLKIFLNTSVGALLRTDGQAYFKTLVEFFEYCIKRNYLPIWRPHPLTESTLISMRPNLIDIYNSIVQLFEKNNIGILDRTASMYQAMRVSDLYYGDASSVEWVYIATRHPVIRRGENGAPSVLVEENKETQIENDFNLMDFMAQRKDRDSMDNISSNEKTIGQGIFDFLMGDINK